MLYGFIEVNFQPNLHHFMSPSIKKSPVMKAFIASEQFPGKNAIKWAQEQK